MIKKQSKNKMRLKRHLRLRKIIFGTKERPRFNVFRSNKGYFLQLIDDENHKTLMSMSTRELGLKSNNIKTAKEIGSKFGTKAKENGYDSVVFDRGGYLYHGKVRFLAESARKSGLKF